MSRDKGSAGAAARTRATAPPAAPEGKRPAPVSMGVWRHLLWLGPALVALVSYWGALSNGFVWDDPLVLRQLRSIRGLGDLFIVPAGITRLYYRPVVFATYLFDRGLGGEQPFWFHFSVLAWHVANTVLVYFLARALLAPGGRGPGVAGRTAPPPGPRSGSGPWPLPPVFAAAAALFFAVHPAHVESVAWMAGRSDVIACAFLLATSLLWLRDTAVAPWLAGASFLLALLTKEPVALAVLVLPLADRGLGRAVRPGRYLPLAAAVAIYLLMRSAGSGLLGEPATPSAYGLADVVRAFGVYVGMSLLPATQTVFYDGIPSSPAFLALGSAAALSIGAGLLWAWRQRRAAVLVSLAWFALTLAPALGLVLRRITSTPIAERYTYIPSVGVCVLVAWLLLRLAERTQRERLVLGLCAGLGLVAAIEVARRNQVWVDDVRFWSAAAASTADATPQRELADALLRRGLEKEAEEAYLLAVERPASPEERATTYSNLGNLYSRGERIDVAIELFGKAVASRPHPTFYHGLGLAWMRKAQKLQLAQGDPRAVTAAIVQARQAFEQAIALGERPDAPSAFDQWQAAKTHLLLGQVLVALDQRDLARQHLELVLRLEPTGVTADTAKQFLAKVQ